MQEEQFKLPDILNQIKKGTYKQTIQNIQQKNKSKTPKSKIDLPLN